MTSEASKKLGGLFRGDGLAARALRSSAFTVFGYGGQQALRLASNLILTRLLFPEAFGMMALVYVFMQGLNNFSDVGVTPAIMQSKRGDDRDFLNTAWTIQIIRGALLWVVTCIIAYPAAQFYDAPQLAQILPVIGLTLVIMGFYPTKLDTANRHLNLGRVTAIDFCSQTVGIVVAVIVAWITGSVWALVVSGLVSSVTQLILLTYFLPGDRNTFRWERASVDELINFGKWIFLSTVAGFFLSQGDKIVLGRYVSLETLGVYNIGFFLASFPLLLGGTITRRILIPIYRELPPKDSPENFKKLQKMRFLVSGALMTMLLVLGVSGAWLVEVLYDPRYLLAGGILVIITCALIPQVIALTYDQAALAAGDSKRFFVLALARTILMLCGLIFGFEAYGLTGALAGQGIAMLIAYPFVVWLARHQGTWDPLHDCAFAVIGALLIAVSLYVNWPAVQAVTAQISP